ncbi:MAG: transporter substrate-binding domain-containing protein [Lentisphaerae bacterium]|nr:transporter substrate-binding domain-containing protein [Lentisphaerota bacterium]
MNSGSRQRLRTAGRRMPPALWLLAGCLLAWLPASARAGGLRLTANERDWLDRNPGRLVLYYDQTFPPLEFAAADGSFAGLGADVAAQIERLLGVSFIRKASDDWNEHLAKLKRGECAIAPTIARQDEREDYTFFTTPYATIPAVIITPQAVEGSRRLDDFEGRRIGVVSGYTTEPYLRDQALLHGFEVVPVPGVSEGLRRVAFGEVDAFVENLASAAYFIEQLGIPNLRVAGESGYVFDFRIGVSRKYPLLFSAVQKALDAIPEDEMTALRQKWISLGVEKWLDPATRRRLWAINGLAVLALAGLAGLAVFLKRRLDNRVAALRDSENRFRRLAENSPAVVYQFRMAPDGSFSFPYIAETVQTLGGFTADEVVADPGTLLSLVPVDDRAKFLAGVRESAKSLTPYEGLFPVSLNGAEIRWIEAHSTPERMPDGSTLWDGLMLDVTGRVRAEAEREQLEAQLLQAQKMEAIGQLAGGVAHDFNNMLGVILGFTEMTLDSVPPGEPLREGLLEIRKAAERSADLTRQLLAFARKQTAAPAVLDLNRTVDGMLGMLRRLIGEQVELVWRPGTDLGPVRMDPTQIDQILVNLCVNARDAIGGEGRVVIETANSVFDTETCEDYPGAVPGSYVKLAVGDSGCGMDRETLAHIFEPFFSTKGVGEGVGLGLATVYGIVKQNNGFIHVYTEPGQGTTFSLYLPRHEAAAVPAPPPEETAPAGTGSGTILLVEDDRSLLGMVRMMLERRGYRVLAAASPAAALRLAGEFQGGIDLLVTDVVMPDMNGRDLAAKLLVLRPGLKRLFMSGYTADVIAHHGVLNEGVHFIQKPFTMGTLMARITEALEDA